jgi:hypothetical protein
MTTRVSDPPQPKFEPIDWNWDDDVVAAADEEGGLSSVNLKGVGTVKTDAEMEKVRKLLERAVPVLRELDLSGLDLEDVSPLEIALKDSAIARLTLDDKSFRPWVWIFHTEMRRLNREFGACQSLRYLSLFSIPPQHATIVCKSFTALRPDPLELVVGGFLRIEDEATIGLMRALVEVQHLDALTVRGVRLTLAELATMESIPQLRILTLQNCALTDKHAASLGNLVSGIATLRHLDLVGNPLGEACAMAIGDALSRTGNHLVTLAIEGSEMGAEGANHLFARLNKGTLLEEIRLRGEKPLVGGSGWEAALWKYLAFDPPLRVLEAPLTGGNWFNFHRILQTNIHLSEIIVPAGVAAALPPDVAIDLGTNTTIRRMQDPPAMRLTKLSGPVRMSQWEVRSRRVTLLGDVHVLGGCLGGLSRDNGQFEVADWLSALSATAPRCLDVMIEAPMAHTTPEYRYRPAVPRVVEVGKYSIPALMRTWIALQPCLIGQCGDNVRFHAIDVRKWHTLESGNVLESAMASMPPGDMVPIIKYLTGISDDSEVFDEFLGWVGRVNFWHSTFREDCAREAQILRSSFGKMLPKMEIDRDMLLRLVECQPRNHLTLMVIVMDMYTMWRLFGSFDMSEEKAARGPSKCHGAATMRDVIIYAGDTHIQTYRKFFQLLGGQELRATGHGSDDYDTTHCLAFDPPFRLFGDVVESG